MLTGVLRNETGQPLAYSDVQACTTIVCLFGESGPDGRFRFELPVGPAQFVIKTPEDVSTTPRRAAALSPVRVSGRSYIAAGSVDVPVLPDALALRSAGGDRQTVEAGDGLELTISLSDLVAPAGKVLVGVAARRIPAAQVPSYDLPGDETIVAVYALHPFAATSRSPMGVNVPSGLPSGTPVRFRTIREIDGSFSEPAPGRATGTHVATDRSAGITELTHVVITR